MDVVFKYEDGLTKSLSDFESYEEYMNSEWASPVDYVKPEDSWSGEEELLQLVFEHPKLFWECNVDSKSDDEIPILLDWIEVFGLHYAEYFDENKVYGEYGCWWAFVESQAELFQEEFETDLTEQQKQVLNDSYNFDLDKFERNLDMEFIMGKYGTVFWRN